MEILPIYDEKNSFLCGSCGLSSSDKDDFDYAVMIYRRKFICLKCYKACSERYREIDRKGFDVYGLYEDDDVWFL